MQFSFDTLTLDLILFIGSREYPEEIGRKQAQEIIDTFNPTTRFLSGGAKGPDTWFEQAAKARGWKSIKIVYPEYNKYGRGAPLFRDEDMAEEATRGIALWDGISSGTAYTMRYLRHQGKEIVAYGPQGQIWDLDKMLKPWKGKRKRP
jgi:hypothetical protein